MATIDPQGSPDIDNFQLDELNNVTTMDEMDFKKR